MKSLKLSLILTGIILLVWGIASWIEVISINNTLQPVYSWWNIFALL